MWHGARRVGLRTARRGRSKAPDGNDLPIFHAAAAQQLRLEARAISPADEHGLIN